MPHSPGPASLGLGAIGGLGPLDMKLGLGKLSGLGDGGNLAAGVEGLVTFGLGASGGLGESALCIFHRGARGWSLLAARVRLSESHCRPVHRTRARPGPARPGHSTPLQGEGRWARGLGGAGRPLELGAPGSGRASSPS